MFKVTGNESFREGYALLAILNNPDFGKDADMRLVKEYTIEVKRELRKWAHTDHRVSSFFDGDVLHKIIKDEGIDGFVELVELPDDIDNRAYADKFFREYVYIEPVNSMFDCTGQAFTCWYHLFKRNGRFYAYHRVGMDV